MHPTHSNAHPPQEIVVPEALEMVNQNPQAIHPISTNHLQRTPSTACAPCGLCANGVHGSGHELPGTPPRHLPTLATWTTAGTDEPRRDGGGGGVERCRSIVQCQGISGATQAWTSWEDLARVSPVQTQIQRPPLRTVSARRTPGDQSLRSAMRFSSRARFMPVNSVSRSRRSSA